MPPILLTLYKNILRKLTVAEMDTNLETLGQAVQPILDYPPSKTPGANQMPVLGADKTLTLPTGAAPWISVKQTYTGEARALYSGQVSSSLSYIGSGFYYNSSNWRTAHTAACIIAFFDTGINFYTDAGLTPNADYAPTQRMRITSVGNLLVGTNTDDTYNKVQVRSGDNYGIKVLNVAESSTTVKMFTAGAGLAGRRGGVQATREGVSAIPLSLQEEGSTVLVGLSTETPSGGCLQLRSGITFPATQVASADPNTLDDCERGTFPPAAVGTTTAGTCTYTWQSGTYVKIGKMVHFQIDLRWSGHTGVGGLKILNMPFLPQNIGTYGAVCGVAADNLVFTGAPFAMLGYNTTYLTINEMRPSSTQAAIPMVAVCNGMRITGSYIAAV